MKKTKEERKKIIYAFMQDKTYVPMKIKELAIVLQVKKEDRAELEEALCELMRENRITVTKRGKYVVSKKKVLTGTFSSTEHGYGFVSVEGEDDYFISKKHIKDAMHSDTVSIEVIKGGGYGRKNEAKIIQVLVHTTTSIVGTFDSSGKGYGFVIPDNKRFTSDVFIPISCVNGAHNGHKVVCEITDYGDRERNPEGKITEILGSLSEPGVDILSVAKQFNLPDCFPKKVENSLYDIPDEVRDEDIYLREDFRHLKTITIDSEDTKDIDDAISLTFSNSVYTLYVHIADVANYVKEASALDKEAKKRGTSVYLADRVIPMLPPKLSNGICSLNEGVDRLALSCIMTIDLQGNVIDHDIKETVICSDRQMTYTEVNAIIEQGLEASGNNQIPSDETKHASSVAKDEVLMQKYGGLVPMIKNMGALADILRRKRKKRGSIDFDVPESKIILDENGRVVDIKPYDRNLATKLIEEFMLLANETIAQHYYFLDVPFVYRVHDKPEPDKIKKLAVFIAGFGYGLKTSSGQIHPKELQLLLQRIDGTNEEALISRLALRSMQRAKYSKACTGHFGLACEYYCHFTSPIRRYPDLQIHRIIKDIIHGRLDDEKYAHYEAILDEVCMVSSSMERLADEAERECDRLKKCQFMESKIGESFTGIISGVTNWGIYVELENTCEGLVHVSKIPGDYFYYNDNTYELIGQGTGKRFSLGSKIDIIVNSVDIHDRTVDFVLKQ